MWAEFGLGAATSLASIASNKRAQKKDEARQNMAAATEGDRLQRAQLARGQVDAVFDSKAREMQRQDFGNALRAYLAQNLQRQKTDVSRGTKFGLARQGLIGGSVDRDANKRLGDEFAEATIGNERNVQGELAGLRGQDEQARLALHGLADKGLGLTQSSRRSLESAQSNLANAEIGARTKQLGDFFTGSTAAYKKANERAELRRGYGYKGTQADIWG